MVVERRMDHPAALGWRARDVRRLWSGCDLWVVVVAVVAAAWMGLVVACIEVWENGVFVSMGCERRCRFLDFQVFFFLHTFRSRISCRMAVFSSSTAKAAIEYATDASGGLELDVYRASVLRMEKSFDTDVDGPRIYMGNWTGATLQECFPSLIHLVPSPLTLMSTYRNPRAFWRCF